MSRNIEDQIAAAQRVLSHRILSVLAALSRRRRICRAECAECVTRGPTVCAREDCSCCTRAQPLWRAFRPSIVATRGQHLLVSKPFPPAQPHTCAQRCRKCLQPSCRTASALFLLWGCTTRQFIHLSEPKIDGAGGEFQLCASFDLHV